MFVQLITKYYRRICGFFLHSTCLISTNPASQIETMKTRWRQDEDTKVIDAKPNLSFLIIMDGFRDVLINIRFRKDISKSIKFS